MTVSERLQAAGLLDQFDAAVRCGDCTAMVELLTQVQLNDQANSIANATLAHFSRFGRAAPIQRLGVAKGKFTAPDDIDADNDLIAELFYGSPKVDQ
jgi:NAD(P)H-nitrite reductase large subunit